MSETFKIELLEYIQQRNDALRIANNEATGNTLAIYEVVGACDELGKLLEFVSETVEGV